MERNYGQWRKELILTARIRQNAGNRSVLSKKQAVLSIVLNWFWSGKQKRKVRQTRMATGLFGGEDGIRTHVRLLANWFRVSPVMTTSIPLRVYSSAVFPRLFWNSKSLWKELTERTTKYSIIRTVKVLANRGFSADETDSRLKNFESVPLWPLRYVSVYVNSLLRD